MPVSGRQIERYVAELPLPRKPYSLLHGQAPLELPGHRNTMQKCQRVRERRSLISPLVLLIYTHLWHSSGFLTSRLQPKKQLPWADYIAFALSFETKHEIMKLRKEGFKQASFSSPCFWLVFWGPFLGTLSSDQNLKITLRFGGFFKYPVALQFLLSAGAPHMRMVRPGKPHPVNKCKS